MRSDQKWSEIYYYFEEYHASGGCRWTSYPIWDCAEEYKL